MVTLKICPRPVPKHHHRPALTVICSDIRGLFTPSEKWEQKRKRSKNKRQTSKKIFAFEFAFFDVNGPSNVFCRFRFKADYVQAVDGMKKHLLRYTEPSRLAFMGALSSVNSRSFRAEMVSTARQVSYFFLLFFNQSWPIPMRLMQMQPPELPLAPALGNGLVSQLPARGTFVSHTHHCMPHQNHKEATRCTPCSLFSNLWSGYIVHHYTVH